MSLIHHVPILKCTVTRQGGVSSFSSDTRVTVNGMVPSATSLAFLCTTRTHRHTHTDWRTDDRIPVAYMSSLIPLLMWRHLFWVVWPCFISTAGTNELHIQCPSVYTTDPPHKGDTGLGGKRRGHHLFSVTHFFGLFLTWKKQTQTLVFVRLLFFSPSPSLSLSIFHRRPDATLLKLPVIWN